jgi:hypothetical protein
MMRMLVEMGVREFDLLQVVPFGRAFTDGRDTLFYDLEEARPYIQEALAFSKRPDVHVWMNRFPPQHLEGYEHLIQDPYKLNDEVRGRNEEFARLLDDGTPLDCREPARCRYCYLEKLCDRLDDAIALAEGPAFEIVRVDTEWEAAQPPVYGGDPASARKSNGEAARRRLPIANRANISFSPSLPVQLSHASLDEIVAASRATTLAVVAPDVQRARAVVDRFASLAQIELRLEDWQGLVSAFGDREIVRCEARTRAQAEALLAMGAQFEVVVDLTRETAPWLLSTSASAPPARFALRQPTYERLTENAMHDVDLRDFFARFDHAIPVEGVPACILGRAPRVRPATLDTTMMASDGRLEIFRYTRRYVASGYMTKSLRCASCAHTATCAGMHVNFVRAHGYSVMRPELRAFAASQSKATSKT